MAELEDEARRRWPIIELALVHRVGDLELGEVSVVVAVSCPHRRRVVRSVPVADRYAQGGRPDLEEGNLGRRERGVGPPGTRPDLRRFGSAEPDAATTTVIWVIMKYSRRTVRPANPGDADDLTTRPTDRLVWTSAQ